MKQKLFILLLALLTASKALANVEINTTNFPDKNFRNWDHVVTDSYEPVFRLVRDFIEQY